MSRGDDLVQNYNGDRFGLSNPLTHYFDFEDYFPGIGSKLVGITSAGYQASAPNAPYLPLGKRDQSGKLAAAKDMAIVNVFKDYANSKLKEVLYNSGMDTDGKAKTED